MSLSDESLLEQGPNTAVDSGVAAVQIGMSTMLDLSIFTYILLW